MPKGIPLTKEEMANRRREIARVAIQLFTENGFNETSMRQIAEAVGAGKSTIYDYFKTKDDILLSYFEDEIQAITCRAEEVDRLQLPAAEKLRQVLHAQLDYMMANRKFYLRLTIEAQRLGFESQQRLQASRHGYQDLICRLIDSGIREGSFRPVDSFLCMRIILSVLGPAVFTTRPTGTPQEMLDSSLDIILRGIQA
jgi:AcrR family transcriptional regulator